MRRKGLLFFALLLAYAGSYIFYSKDGIYEPGALGAKRSGEKAIFASKGFGVIWQPFGSAWLDASDRKTQVKNWVYYPLIVSDRALWHTNRAELRLP